MKKLITSTALAAVMAVGVAGTASAGFIYDDTGVNTAPISTANDFKAQLEGLGFNSLTTDHAAGATAIQVSTQGTITFRYHGKEAGHTTGFRVDGLLSDQRPGATTAFDPVGQIIGSISGSAAQLNALFADWEFFDVNDGSVAGLGSRGFGVFTTSGAINPNFIVMGYDDTGAGPDDNHDDYILSASFQAPEPGILGLMGVGLLGLGFAAMRRRA